jgi:hypothetical protein
MGTNQTHKKRPGAIKPQVSTGAPPGTRTPNPRIKRRARPCPMSSKSVRSFGSAWVFAFGGVHRDPVPSGGVAARVAAPASGSEHLLRRSVCAAGRPAYSQVRRRIGLSASDRKFPPLTGRSGTQRARPLRPVLAAPLGVWPSSQLTRCALPPVCSRPPDPQEWAGRPGLSAGSVRDRNTQVHYVSIDSNRPI